MHKLVSFRERQEVTPDDLNNTGGYAQGYLDHLNADAITSTKRYRGFETVATSTTKAEVGVGRLYTAGPGYVLESAVEIEMITKLPTANKKKVAIVVYGSSLETVSEARDYLLNADTGETEPRAVAMQQLRMAEVAAIYGTESPDPELPSIAEQNLHVATVTLSTSGIEAIEMVVDNQLKNLDEIDTRLDGVESWQTSAGYRLDTISSDLGAIGEQASRSPSFAVLESVMFDLAEIRDQVGLPSDHNAFQADMFMNEDESNVDRTGHDAEVDLGLHFPDDAANVAQLALFNAFEDKVVTSSDGLCIPAHTHAPRISVPGYGNQKSITEFQVATWTLVRRSWSRIRQRRGNRYVTFKGESRLHVLRRTKAGPNSEPPGSKYPVAPMVYRRKKSGEAQTVFQKKRVIKHTGVYRYDANKRFYRSDWHSEPYWTYIKNSFTVDGGVLGQSFLNQQEGYLTKLDIYFTQLAAAGDCTVAIVELNEDGTPDADAVLADVTLARADMSVYPLATSVAIGPVYLKAGRQYAFTIYSQANHWMALGDRVSYTGGNFFQSVDGNYWAGNIVDDLKMTLYYAQFNESRVEVQLQPLSLSGGIAEIDLNFDGYIPENTSLDFQIKRPGGAWESLKPKTDEEDDGVTTYNPPFYDLPPLLEFRAVYSGTPDVMPAMNLAESQQYISRPKVALTHISETQTIPVASESLKIRVTAAAFNDANHDLDCEIEVVPDSGTWITPDSFVDTILDDDITMREFTFSTGVTALTDFTVKVVGATLEAHDIFQISGRTWIALPA